jgi:predicted aspartyl protease
MAMKDEKSFTSEHFPYLPVTVLINKHLQTFEALLDTGFEGDIIIPEDSLASGQTPDSYIRFTLADPTATVLAPSFLGKVEVAQLGDAGSSPAIISVMGTEPIIGRNLARRFHISLAYGKRVTIHP